MKIEISTRDALLALGGLAIGLAITGLAVNRTKSKIRKELISETSNKIKKEIVNEIKEEIAKVKDEVNRDIQTDKIINDIKKDIDDTIVDDILKESKNNMSKLIKTMDDFQHNVEKRLNRFEDRLDNRFDRRRDKELCIDLNALFFGKDDYDDEY